MCRLISLSLLLTEESPLLKFRATKNSKYRFE